MRAQHAKAAGHQRETRESRACRQPRSASTIWIARRTGEHVAPRFRDVLFRGSGAKVRKNTSERATRRGLRRRDVVLEHGCYALDQPYLVDRGQLERTLDYVIQ